MFGLDRAVQNPRPRLDVLWVPLLLTPPTGRRAVSLLGRLNNDQYSYSLIVLGYL